VSSFADSLRDPVVYAIPVFASFMALEFVSLRYLGDDDPRAHAYEADDTRTNLLMGFGSLIVNGSARVVALLCYAALYVLTPLRFDSHRWYTWVVALLLVDLLFYSEHRAAHRVRILWAAHQAHHNSRRFNLSTAVRQKWNPWWELLVWAPLPLIGVPPWLIFTSFSINLIVQFFVHTERVDRMWRPIEFVFNTPSHHRVHHASDPEYLDRNYAGILIIWDRIFGSYAEETHRPTYGLTNNIDSFNPFRSNTTSMVRSGGTCVPRRRGASVSATSSRRPAGNRGRCARNSTGRLSQQPDDDRAASVPVDDRSEGADQAEHDEELREVIRHDHQQVASRDPRDEALLRDEDVRADEQQTTDRGGDDGRAHREDGHRGERGGVQRDHRGECPAGGARRTAQHPRQRQPRDASDDEQAGEQVEPAQPWRRKATM
jgi:sterol desaturase/sphingolipid hydroxylase (fatty acid hydroxylase superfamily)